MTTTVVSRLRAEPGTRFRHSNLGVGLLGLALAGADGLHSTVCDLLAGPGPDR